MSVILGDIDGRLLCRYFHGKHGLKEMRERFGVMKLMPFLHSIKELDIVGTHPEVTLLCRGRASAL